MKLINEEKVKVASFNYAQACCPSDDRQNVCAKKDFKEGVLFAETELQDLAIEFAEWVIKYNFGSLDMYIDYKSEFTKFITERNK